VQILEIFMVTTWRMLRQPTSPKRGRYSDISSRKSIQRRSENAVHPSWGYHAEELLFYTSRYYAQTETFLRAISGVSDFSFGGFRAQRLTPAQQQSLARLLRRPAGHATARAVVALIRRITICRGTRALPSQQTVRRRPLTPGEIARSRQRGPRGLSPADPFLNIAERFGLPVRQRGRHLWVSFSALKRLLDAPSPALRNAVHDAIEVLHDGGFHLHRRRPG
jgi:hypothetical protein